jgi:ribosomal protein L36
MKLKSSLRRLCTSCYFVTRQASDWASLLPDAAYGDGHTSWLLQGRLFVYCKNNPRHKQRQGRGPRRKLHTGPGGEETLGLPASPLLEGVGCGCNGERIHEEPAP